MIIVPTDILHIALSGGIDDIALLSIEKDIETEEKETKEHTKEKDKNKISPRVLGIMFSGQTSIPRNSRKKYNRIIKPKVLHLEVHTPPPEQA